MSFFERSSSTPWLAASFGLAASGCGLVLGLDQFVEQTATGTTSTTGTTGTGGNGGAGGSGGAGTTTTSSTGAGGEPECTKQTAASACDDKNPCTDEACDANGLCQHSPATIGTACGSGAKFACDATGTCIDGHTLWADRFGEGTGEHSGEAIAADKDGNVLVTGYYHGDLDLGGGPLPSPSNDSAFLVKLDPTGKALWGKQLAAAGMSVFGRAVAVDTLGNIVLAGTIPGITVTKLDPMGNTLWAAPFKMNAVSYADAYAVAVSPAGDVLAAGIFGGSVDFGNGNSVPGNNALFVVKLTPAGQLVWVKTVSPSAGSVSVASLATDAAGNVVYVGKLSGSANFGGGVFATAGAGDAFFVKLDATGKHVWSGKLGDAADQRATGVAIDAGGQIYVAGAFAGMIDLGMGVTRTSAGKTDGFVIKLNSAEGKPLWTNTFGGTGNDGVSSVAVDAAGNVLAGGDFLGAVDFGGGAVMGSAQANTFLVKFSSTGAHLWSHGYADAIVNAVAGDAMGNTLSTGTFVGATDFGGGIVLNTVGDLNIFVAKMSP